MKVRGLLAIGLVTLVVPVFSSKAEAQNTADATLELTYTLTNVTITDTLTNTTNQAVFQTTAGGGGGDLLFEDFGPNGSTIGAGSSMNPVGSVGSTAANETILVNGLDPFDDDIDINEDSFGIGDSIVLTLGVSASAETPGSVFFAQVNSDNTLFFQSFGDPTEQLEFFFDYSAVLTGTLDSSPLPGTAIAVADNSEVSSTSRDFDTGDSNTVVVATDLFLFGVLSDDSLSVPLNDSASGNFAIAFGPGDSDLTIDFQSELVVNARVNAVPEPNSLALALLLPLSLARRKRRQ